jgi:hypothetical protein
MLAVVAKQQDLQDMLWVSAHCAHRVFVSQHQQRLCNEYAAYAMPVVAAKQQDLKDMFRLSRYYCSSSSSSCCVGLS